MREGKDKGLRGKMNLKGSEINRDKEPDSSNNQEGVKFSCSKEKRLRGRKERESFMNSSRGREES